MPTTSIDVKDVLVAIVEAPFKFHLTGSRFFGYENDDSDWDFFIGIITAQTRPVRKWLLENGFFHELNDHYNSPPFDPLNDALQVWRHHTVNVHIQIVSDARKKLRTQEAINNVPGIANLLRALPKEQRSLIWKMGRAVFDAGISAGLQWTTNPRS